MKFSSSMKAVVTCSAACVFFSLGVSAQEASENEIAYAEVLQAIADQKVSIAQTQLFVSKQDAQIKALEAQIENVDELTASIEPMIEKMTAAIEDSINADYPFDIDRRLARLVRLQTMVDNPEAKLVEKYRTALDTYKIEVNYGQSLESYQGNHPITPTVRQGDDRYEKDEEDKIKLDEKTGQPIELFDGNYLRYGRTAFVYLNKNNTDPLRYDLTYEPTAEELEKCQGIVDRCKWRKIPKGKTVEIRRAIRVSRGEVAPTVVAAPISPMP